MSDLSLPHKPNRFLRFLKILGITIASTVVVLALAIIIAAYYFIDSWSKSPTSSVRTKPSQIESAIAPSSEATQEVRSTSVPLEAEKEKRTKRTRRKERTPEENEKLTIEMRKTGAFFKDLEVINKDSRLQNASPLCDIICDESTLRSPTEEEENQDRTAFLDIFKDFYQTEGGRAFEDPAFRLQIQLLTPMGELMAPVLEIMEEIEPILKRDKESFSHLEKVYWAARAPAIMIKTINHINNVQDRLKADTKKASKLRKLRKSCQTTPHEEVQEKCWAL